MKRSKKSWVVLFAVSLLAGGYALTCSGGDGHDQADQKTDPHAGHDHGDGKAATTATPASGADSFAQSSRHGGQVTATKAYHFETVSTKTGFQVYLYNADQAPLMVEAARGTAVLKYKNGTTKELTLVSEKPGKDEPTVYFCPMHPPVVQMEPGKCDLCGGMVLYIQNRLAAKVDLTKAEPGSLEAVFTIKGLSKEEPSATFTQAYAPVVQKAATR